MNDQDDAELGADGLSSWKNADNLVGMRAGRDVVIRRFDTQHHVTHTTANQIRFVSVLAQFLNYFDGGIGLHREQNGRGRGPWLRYNSRF